MKVYLVVLDTLADWEVAYLTAELHSRRFFANPLAPFELVRVGLTAATIHTMGGMAITPDITIADLRLEADDLLLLPGSERWGEPIAQPALVLARDLIAGGRKVAAICGATEGLAQVGALDTLRHTSNDLDNLRQTCPGYGGAARYVHEPVVRDANLVTASGLAPLEFTREVLELLDVWRVATLEAWYQLHRTREAHWFHALVASMQPPDTTPPSAPSAAHGAGSPPA